jgi:hypothetical protein
MQSAKGRNEPLGLGGTDAHDDVDPGRTQLRDPTTIHMGRRISTTNHNATKPSRNHGIDAGGCLSLVTAWLKRHKQIAAGTTLASRCDRMNLCMRSATPLVPSFGNPAAVRRHHNGANRRVGLNQPKSLAGEFQCVPHDGFIRVKRDGLTVLPA